MFAKKTRIISLLLAVVLLLCPLQAASAETQTPNEKIEANLIEQIEQKPDEKFGVYVILDLDNDEIKRQAREIWEKDTDPNKDDFNHFAAVYERNFCIEYEDDFLSEAGLTAEDRIMKLWWALGEYVVLDKEQIYRIAEMDQVKFLRFFGTYPIKMCVYKYTCEDALRILQAAVGLVSSNDGPYFDVNQDWSVDMFDALLALQSAVGLRTISWPEGMAFPE